MSDPIRICIGESGNRGLPISAPLATEPDDGIIRWIQRGESFSLQRFSLARDCWEDVPVIKESDLPS